MSEQAPTNENVVLTITVGSTPGVVAVGPNKPVLTGTTNVVLQIGTGQSGTAGATAPAATFEELTIVNLTTGQLVAP